MTNLSLGTSITTAMNASVWCAREIPQVRVAQLPVPHLPLLRLARWSPLPRSGPLPPATGWALPLAPYHPHPLTRKALGQGTAAEYIALPHLAHAE